MLISRLAFFSFVRHGTWKKSATLKTNFKTQEKLAGDDPGGPILIQIYQMSSVFGDTYFSPYSCPLLCIFLNKKRNIRVEKGPINQWIKIKHEWKCHLKFQRKHGSKFDQKCGTCMKMKAPSVANNPQIYTFPHFSAAHVAFFVRAKPYTI